MALGGFMDLVYRSFDVFVQICAYITGVATLWSAIQLIIIIISKVTKRPNDLGWPITILQPLIVAYKLLFDDKREEVKTSEIILSVMFVIGLIYIVTYWNEIIYGF